MIEFDEKYRAGLTRILNDGIDRPDRTGVGSRAVFDMNINVNLKRHDDRCALPALTMRKVFPRSAWYELFWMLRGSTDARELQEKGISIWDGNSSREFLDSRGLHHIREGFIGDGYGKQFRNFNGVDQLKEVMKSLLVDPNGRRHYISLWNPADLKNTALPPCHTTYNFMVTGEYLNLKFFQRSADYILGVPMNIMFAAFFLSWMASVLGYKVGNLAHSMTDCHVYENHKQAIFEMMLNRDHVHHEASFQLPKSPYGLKSVESIDSMLEKELDFMFDDRSWEYVKNSLDYISNPALPKEMLVMAV